MRNSKKIKVLVVEDSLLFREFLVKNISNDLAIEVIATASNPYEARDRILEFEPDVVTLDVEMPRMNGIEFLKKLMPQYPLPIIVVSATDKNVFDALDSGAVDFVAKPNVQSTMSMNSFINELIIKIKIASTAKVAHMKSGYQVETSKLNNTTNKKNIIVAIGASTGGTEAIYEVVKAFPRDMTGVVIVQHMPPVFTRMYADRINNSCAMEAKEAEDGDIVRPGRILIAPGDFQMKLVKGDSNNYRVRCYKGEKINGHCPAVDVLFNSVAQIAGKNAIGVILTGMGQDGAKGLLEMKKHGAYTIGQDEKSCVVYGMPMVAFNIGAVQKQVPLNKIAETVLSYIGE